MSLFWLFWFLKFHLKVLKVWLLSVRVDLEWSRCAAASESTMKSCSIYSCASRFKNTSTVWWSRHTITQRLMKVSWITQNLWLPAPGGKYHEPLRPVGFFITYIRLGGSGLVLRHSSSDLDERMNRRMDGGMDRNLQRCLRHRVKSSDSTTAQSLLSFINKSYFVTTLAEIVI